jgi:tRNA (adenine22-N1)-methyltransferase
MAKLSKRIDAILNRIKKKNAIIIDVGCDHCYTSIFAITKKQVKFAYNIDIAKKPLENGIKNIEKYGLIEKTNNIVNDGLKDLNIKEKIDYCIISGLGGNTIKSIIENKSNTININKFICVCNNKIEVLRNYFSEKKIIINFEEIINDCKINYFLIEVSYN